MFDQDELMRVDGAVVLSAVSGGTHPVVETVDGDERWWAGLLAWLSEFFEEVLPCSLSDAGVFGTGKGDVVKCLWGTD